MAQFNQTDTAAASIANPETGDRAWFTDGGVMKLKDPAGVVTIVGSGAGRFLRRTLKTSGNHVVGADCGFVNTPGWGGGGGSGGVIGSAIIASASGGGASGAKVEKFFAIAPSGTITLTYGAAGAAGAAGNNNGGAGGDSTLVSGAVSLVAKGGLGGLGSAGSTANAAHIAGGAGQLSTGGDVNGYGRDGGVGRESLVTGPDNVGGRGGDTEVGRGGAEKIGAVGTGSHAANAGTGYGAGAGGCCTYGGANTAGAAGTIGCWIIDEYSA